MGSRYRRLIVGGGRRRDEDPYPGQRPGDLTLDINQHVQPHIQGDIFRPPFKPESFDAVIFERFPYCTILNCRPTGIEHAHRVLKPGGRLAILTGCAPLGDLIPHLIESGFIIDQLELDKPKNYLGELENRKFVYISAHKE